jgi:DNA-binding beta-propeller fold protein YncE
MTTFRSPAGAAERGHHRIAFEVVAGWERLPDGVAFTEVAGVACDSRDRVYLFCRGAHPVIVFDRDGRFVTAWGAGIFTNPHGITITPNDRVFLTDNFDHTIREFTADGVHVRTLGTPGVASDTGFELDHAPLCRAAGPFNMVCNCALNAKGEMYVADGYANARVHKFAADGTLVKSWGEPGAGPGQFNLPHGIALDSAGQVYVADRENSRVQIFDGDGNYLDQWTWPNRPSDLFIDAADRIYVAEMGFRPSPLPVHYRNWMSEPPLGHDTIARVTVCEPDGSIVARIGGADPFPPGNFVAPHGLWVDSTGAIYVGEVTKAARKVWAPLDPRCFQKFRRA